MELNFLILIRKNNRKNLLINDPNMHLIIYSFFNFSVSILLCLNKRKKTNPNLKNIMTPKVMNTGAELLGRIYELTK